MKSLWSTLVIFMLLAYLVTGSWYVKKCANKMGNCRKKCRNGEMKTDPATSKCPKDKQCCVLDIKDPHCGTENPNVEGSGAGQPGATGAAGAGAGAGAGATQAADGGASAAASTAAP